MKQRDKPWRASDAVKQQARELRQQMTPAEKTFWQQLCERRLHGLRFRRQAPVGGFIADFYCASARLVVEVDGEVHKSPEQAERDGLRTAELEAQGYRVIRFTNEEVETQLSQVLAQIADVCGITTES